MLLRVGENTFPDRVFANSNYLEYYKYHIFISLPLEMFTHGIRHEKMLPQMKYGPEIFRAGYTATK